MKITKKHVTLAGIVALIAIAILLNTAPHKSGVTGGAIAVGADDEKVRLGSSSISPLNSLVTIADNKGFFADEGFDIELTEFNSGKEALQAFLGGSLDLSVSGEVPVMFSALQGNEFYIITQLVGKTNGHIRVVALRDDELNDPQSYFKAEKRKLATPSGSGPEFYTYKFLKRYNITEVEIVNQKPSDMPVTLASKSVDAIVVFDPFAFIAEQKLGNSSISFNDADLYSELFVLVGHKDWVDTHPAETEKIVSALKKAADFIRSNPGEAKAIISKSTKLDSSVVDGIWGRYLFEPTLNNLLLENLNAEVQWAKETGKVKPETTIPDFTNYLYTEALGKVAPEDVTI